MKVSWCVDAYVYLATLVQALVSTYNQEFIIINSCYNIDLVVNQCPPRIIHDHMTKNLNLYYNDKNVDKINGCV